MLTTKQVRNIIRNHRRNDPYGTGMWTNKTTGDTSNIRRVKCYYEGDDELVALLRKAAGRENVTVTSGAFFSGEGITVRCVIAE